MASWAELKRAGADGFAIVEDYMVRPATRRRPAVQQVYNHSHGCLYQHQPSQSVEHHVKPVSAAEEMMSFYEGVQFREAVSIMDYSKRKSRAMGY